MEFKSCPHALSNFLAFSSSCFAFPCTWQNTCVPSACRLLRKGVPFICQGSAAHMYCTRPDFTGSLPSRLECFHSQEAHAGIRSVQDRISCVVPSGNLIFRGAFVPLFTRSDGIGIHLPPSHAFFVEARPTFSDEKASTSGEFGTTPPLIGEPERISDSVFSRAIKIDSGSWIAAPSGSRFCRQSTSNFTARRWGSSVRDRNVENPLFLQLDSVENVV